MPKQSDSKPDRQDTQGASFDKDSTQGKGSPRTEKTGKAPVHGAHAVKMPPAGKAPRMDGNRKGGY